MQIQTPLFVNPASPDLNLACRVNGLSEAFFYCCKVSTFIFCYSFKQKSKTGWRKSAYSQKKRNQGVKLILEAGPKKCEKCKKCEKWRKIAKNNTFPAGVSWKGPKNFRKNFPHGVKKSFQTCFIHYLTQQKY